MKKARKNLVKKLSVFAAMAFMMLSFFGFKPVNNFLGLDSDGMVVYADDVPQVTQVAGGAALGNGNADYDSGSGVKSADNAYRATVSVFITWIRRIGALVGFVGAIMFALATKNNDADQKQNGLLTMIAGFMAWAICQATSLFDIFS